MKKRNISEKYFSFFSVKGTLVYHAGILILSIVTFFFLQSEEIRLTERQLHILFEIGPVVVIVWTVFSAAVILKFRSQVDQLLKAIRSIADGNLVISVNAKDKSDYGTACKDLSRVADELKGSKDEMQQFTNEFLHEIKTPITAISGFAEYLIETGEGIESPERMRYLQIIADESVRLSDLSQKTLMLAKVDACQIVTDKIEYLGEQIKRCTILMLREIEKKNIDLELDVENLHYYGNPEFMEQVWLNLISNAIKFTPANGEISIQGTSEEKGITLTFTDSGPGMDEETRQHLFEKYYQGASGRKAGGNGIGLSIVHRIITLCGGTISVTSSENAGSTFTVFLPNA